MGNSAYPPRTMKQHSMFQHKTETVTIDGVTHPKITHVHNKNIKKLPNDWSKNWIPYSPEKLIDPNKKPKLPANDTLQTQRSIEANKGTSDTGAVGSVIGQDQIKVQDSKASGEGGEANPAIVGGSIAKASGEDSKSTTESGGGNNGGQGEDSTKSTGKVASTTAKPRTKNGWVALAESKGIDTTGLSISKLKEAIAKLEPKKPKNRRAAAKAKATKKK